MSDIRCLCADRQIPSGPAGTRSRINRPDTKLQYACPSLHGTGGGRDRRPRAGPDRPAAGDKGTPALAGRARCSRPRRGRNRGCVRPRSSWPRGRPCPGTAPGPRRSPPEAPRGRSGPASHEPDGACTKTAPASPGWTPLARLCQAWAEQRSNRV